MKSLARGTPQYYLGVKMKITEDTWKLIEDTLRDLNESTKALYELSELICLPVDSPLLTPQYMTSEALISSLSRLVGDTTETIAWWVFECDYGDDPMEAGVDENMRTIHSFKDLRWLIELTTK